MKTLVANLGGVFIYAVNMKQLAEWYKQMLGIDYEYTEAYNCCYSSFNYHPIENPTETRSIAWSILDLKGRPKPEGKFFTLNFRVYNMDETIAHLRANNVTVADAEVYPEGKFAHLVDCEGNAIELWEDVAQAV